VITAAALVPHPPLLLRELGGGHDGVARLRTAALDAVRAVVGGADRVVLVGPADECATWDAAAVVDVRRFGTTGERPSGEPLPLSLAVGVRLLAEAGWTGPVDRVGVAWDSTDEELEALAGRLGAAPGRTAVVLLGDGSARRGEQAPGHLDQRAFAFDDGLADALAAGDAGALAGLDVVLAAELMVLGRSTLRLLGLLALREGQAPRAALTHRDDPHGVSYLVATWRFPALTGER